MSQSVSAAKGNHKKMGNDLICPTYVPARRVGNAKTIRIQGMVDLLPPM